MKTVTVHDKTFAISIPESEILKAVQQVADAINRDYKDKNPLFIVVLNGAFIFASDLFKRMNNPCEISFVKVASYSGTESTKKIKQLIGLNESIPGRDLIIVEDIIDSGFTMAHFLNQLHELEPKSIKIASLLFKPDAFQKDFKIDYLGMEITNDFIVGYGLDYNGHGRNYADIYKIVE